MSCCENENHLVDGWHLHVQQPDSDDFYLVFDSPFAGQISSLVIQAGLGSGVASVKINANAVEGIASVAFDTAKVEFVATDNNSFAPGDRITLSLLSQVDLLSLRATVKYSR